MSRGVMAPAWRKRPVSAFLATGLGVGMIPLAPGTWGSLLGLGMALALACAFGPGRSGSGGLIILLCAAAVFAVGVAVSSRTEEVCGEKDPSQVVVDEIAGQMIACAPAAFDGQRLWVWILALVLFRLLDIWKPGPINRLQNLRGGWGIMLDDVAAGIAAGVLTFLVAEIRR